jgi:tetratricopeptide (TPR) repeat protein
MSGGGRALIVPALLLCAIWGAVSASEVWAMSREEALAAIQGSPDVGLRRRAVEGLGETGIMADVPLLTDALRDSDATVRVLAEQSLWQVWSRSGDPAVDEMFRRGVGQLQRGELSESIETFTDVIRRRPDFAEGWNKRATAYYLNGALERSLADCDEVMKRNPVHFGALSGYGLIYLQLGDAERALRSFEQALGVNPNLAGIRQAVEDIRRLLDRRRAETT